MRYADAHCDISANILYSYPEKLKFFGSFTPEKEGWLPHQIDLKKILQSGVRLMVWSICPVEMKDKTKIKISDQWSEFLKHFNIYQTLLEQYSDFFSLVTSSKDLEHIIHNSNKIAIILHLEGIDCITRPDQVQEVFELGVRSFGPCGITSNEYAISGTEHPQSKEGFSEKGFALIKKIMELPVAVDFAHLNQSSFFDLARISQQPVYVSHTACHSIHPNGQNMTFQQMEEIKRTKGLMGLPLFPFLLTGSTASIEDYRGHVREALKNVGQSGICIGSDFDGMFNPVLEDGECISDIPSVMQRMNMGADELESFAFGNLFRFFSKVLS